MHRIFTITIFAALVLAGFAPATLAQDEERQNLEESGVRTSSMRMMPSGVSRLKQVVSPP